MSKKSSTHIPKTKGQQILLRQAGDIRGFFSLPHGRPHKEPLGEVSAPSAHPPAQASTPTIANVPSVVQASATPFSGLTLDSSVVSAAGKKRGRYKDWSEANNLIALKQAIEKKNSTNGKCSLLLLFNFLFM